MELVMLGTYFCGMVNLRTSLLVCFIQTKYIYAMDLKNFYSHDTNVYNLEGFVPQIVDAEYLRNLGVTAQPSEATLQGLIKGSKLFMERVQNRTVIPVSKLTIENIDPDKVRGSANRN